MMTDYRLKERSINFSKEEISRLQLLIDKYKNVLMCKKTDGSSAKQKDHAWCCIEKEFNAVGEIPRTVKQLKYKFENMKRGAKKEACRERQEMIRTGGGKPPSLPPESEEATDWLRSLMSGSIDGNEAVYDDDVMTPKSHSTPKHEANIKKSNPDDDHILPVHKKAKLVINIDDLEDIVPIEKVQNADLDDNIIMINENQMNIAEAESAPIFDSSTPHCSLRKPLAPPLKRIVKKKLGKESENIIKKALREKKLSVLEGLHDLELERIKLTISQQKELHEQLMRHNEAKHKLEIIKLQLEIDALREKSKQ